LVSIASRFGLRGPAAELIWARPVYTEDSLNGTRPCRHKPRRSVHRPADSFGDESTKPAWSTRRPLWVTRITPSTQPLLLWHQPRMLAPPPDQAQLPAKCLWKRC